MKRKTRKRRPNPSLPDASVSVLGSVGYGLVAGLAVGVGLFTYTVIRAKARGDI